MGQVQENIIFKQGLLMKMDILAEKTSALALILHQLQVTISQIMISENQILKESFHIKLNVKILVRAQQAMLVLVTIS